MFRVFNKSIKSKLKLFTFLLFMFIYGQSQIKRDTLITQTITYKTARAGHVYLVWDINGWNIPDKKYWSSNGFLERNMVWSKMNGSKDSFSLAITLPVNTQLDFMFWVPIDAEGDSTDGWDTYGEQTYNSKFTDNKKIVLPDTALWVPEKRRQFNVLENGLKFLIASLCLSILLIFTFRKRLIFSTLSLITGCIVISLIVAGFARMELNNLFGKNNLLVFGAMFSDLLWFLSTGLFFISLLLILKRHPTIKVIVTVLSPIIIISSVLFCLINIDVVKFLGRPVNYQWLYYSDFMTGSDVKSAINKNVSLELVLNLVFFMAGVIIFTITFSFLPRNVAKMTNVGLGVTALLIFCVSFYQYRTKKYEAGKVVNPSWELISSTIISQRSSKLFSMNVPAETKNFIDSYHNQNYTQPYDTALKIDNIIIFVLESTPANMVSVYDSTYNVTPNIKRWKNISTVFTNAYSHLPATVYAMGPLVAGVYPLISYESMIASYPDNSVPSISSELKKQQWTSSLFFAADLAYSNMGMYAKKQGFDVTEDNTTIQCRFPKFGNTNTFLDQLDDRCLVDKYFNWADSLHMKKKFSILWTTQTHYEYFIRSKEVEYVKGKPDMNRYLNALRENDEVFGMLMDGLKQRNQLSNTLVILTADHGEAFGTHDQIVHASKIYEENVRIPLIMYNPDLFKGETKTTISGLVDIPPTIAHLAGIKKPIPWQGKTLLTNSSGGDRTFFICPFNDFLFGTRSGNWKYIYNAARNEGELYDLTSDPGELKNLVSEFPAIAKKEFEMLAGWVQYHNKLIKPYLK